MLQHKKNYLPLLLASWFAFLAALALVLEANELHLIFGISLVFTNVVLLMMIRCYGLYLGLPVAVLVYGVSIWGMGAPYFRAVFLLELIAVGLLLRQSKKDAMLRADSLFWLCIGGPLILAVYFVKDHSISVECWLMIFVSVTNGLANVLAADILHKYLPVVQIKKGFTIREVPLTFSKILFQVISVCIALPFLFYAVNNSRTAENSVSSYADQLASNTAQHIKMDINSSDISYADGVLSLSPQQEQELKVLIERYSSRDNYRIILSGPQNEIVADNNPLSDGEASSSLSSDVIYSRSQPSGFYLYGQKARIVMPMERWDDAQYISHSDMKPLPFKLTILVPLAPYRADIYAQHLNQFLFLILLFVCASAVGKLLTRRILHSLVQLTTLTTNLPDKLVSSQQVTWPKSRIYEVRSLIHNFRMMSNKLVHMLQDSLQNNLLLEEQTARLIKSEKKLHKLAYYDMLTDLPNRLHFKEYTRSLNLESDEEPKRPFAVMFADLNRFKQVNDTLGHSIGDLLISMVAARFAALVSEACKLFRLSGDEFLFVLHYEDIQDVQEVAQQICQLLEEPFDIGGRPQYITVSVGISVYPFDGFSMEQVMRNADIAMYVAKEQGDGLYHFYDNLIENERAESMQLEADLRRALHGGQFRLYYQPKIDAASREIIGAEALLRWLHPDFGSVPPDKFIPLAENSGIILDIDEWVLREACRQNKQWQDDGLARFPVAVNISARHFYQNNLIPMITRTLRETGLEPKYLVLEITEGMLIRNVEYSVRVLEELRQMGIHISMDDFGTGYSSLSQLDRLPLSEMKLDRSFLSGLLEDSRKSSIVRAVIELGHHMDLQVVAEGIEASEELEYLTELECDQFQGYFFSKPLPSKEFIMFVKHWIA
ncbi:hypothetical protein J41TS12_02350 [Paenibacillus antibioticophila]|uniref:EAL domain-containing protein n=1 Tax=Paenibacillus antibioticophila TaxID=1274374 RepID=A0A919XM96_9BACL|nr:EAL domain-containing protein [Paenibacillus antibioticophila]GIO35374.1 hypothetical protein J41TS12_02350 [Paenibacillus antibioticophila]